MLKLKTVCTNWVKKAFSYSPKMQKPPVSRDKYKPLLLRLIPMSVFKVCQMTSFPSHTVSTKKLQPAQYPAILPQSYLITFDVSINPPHKKSRAKIANSPWTFQNATINQRSSTSQNRKNTIIFLRRKASHTSQENENPIIFTLLTRHARSESYIRLAPQFSKYHQMTY